MALITDRVRLRRRFGAGVGPWLVVILVGAGASWAGLPVAWLVGPMVA